MRGGERGRGKPTYEREATRERVTTRDNEREAGKDATPPVTEERDSEGEGGRERQRERDNAKGREGESQMQH